MSTREDGHRQGTGVAMGSKSGVMPYFSETRGLRQGIDLTALRVMVRDLYLDLTSKEHLTEWLGYYCVDAGQVAGTAGEEPGRDIVLEVGRTDVWPPNPVEGQWPEDAIFDFLQFIGEKVSSPIADTGTYHGFNNCGWHDQDFRPEPARGEYVQRVNKILSRYGDGWEMKPGFEIVERAPIGMDAILKVKLPEGTDSAIRTKVHAAVDKFRRRSSSRDDRRDAVRDLGDVFEPLKQVAIKHLSKDASDLFNILNNFDFRHNNELQKKDYDTIWMSGLFYHYLMMIHVLTHMIDREGRFPK
jgi:hypothetical protein